MVNSGAIDAQLYATYVRCAFERSAEPIQLPISGMICSQFGQKQSFDNQNERDGLTPVVKAIAVFT